MAKKAVIYKSTGSWYIAKTPDGGTYNTRIKGVFKIDEITSTNPVAVGDEVILEPETDHPGQAMITEICSRRNYMARQSPAQRMQQHIVAANIDQAIVLATLREPRTSTGFIDRLLVTCEAYHIPAVVLFNKLDLYRKKELDKLEELAEVYSDAGYRVLATSVVSGEGLEELRQVLSAGVSVLSGHSGVGKSSLINAMFPDFRLKTGDVSGWSGKGMHTTTFAEMFDLPSGGRLIDTPGLREFGIVHIDRQELSHYFPEMRGLLPHCQFNNCMHLNEPGCAIKKAVEDGRIFADRYISYLNILDSLGKKY